MFSEPRIEVSYKDAIGAYHTGSQWQRAVVDIEVDGEMPVIPGYTFIGSKVIKDGVTKFSCYDPAEASRIENADMAVCDHCGRRRSRNGTYFLKNEAGEIKQVGRSCLNDFTGFKGIDSLLSVLDFNFVESDHEANGPWMVGLRVAVNLAINVIRNEGRFLSQSKCGDTETPTSTSMLLMMDPDLRAKWGLKITDFSDDVTAAIEWIKGNFNEDNGFNMNVRSVFSNDYTNASSFSFIAPAVWQYLKGHDPKFAAPAPVAEKVVLEHFGEAGKRYRGVDVEVVAVKDMGENLYARDGSHNVLVTLKSGNALLKWFTSKEFDLGSYKADFTVKKLDSYRGEKQTVITRAKLV